MFVGLINENGLSVFHQIVVEHLSENLVADLEGQTERRGDVPFERS